MLQHVEADEIGLVEMLIGHGLLDRADADRLHRIEAGGRADAGGDDRPPGPWRHAVTSPAGPLCYRGPTQSGRPRP